MINRLKLQTNVGHHKSKRSNHPCAYFVDGWHDDIITLSANLKYILILSDNLKDAMDFERKFIGETGKLASSDDTLQMMPSAERYSVHRSACQLRIG
ncbi:hypothetical protein FGIG_03006 [Fasciola gigantica]|uniref:Uncharacterized protein n=1 Tax=Fasciola gigantica TaxID=46835 RepID=A0A504YDQ6_FASGI|nr:hypothetical protein FGIG_03006 [Fasciola gigantica]